MVAVQLELKRLVLPDAEQPSQTALKEQVIRLRLVVGLPAPGEVKDEDAKPYSAQGDIKDEEKDGQTVVMSFPSDAFGPSKPEQNRFRREMQKKYNKELKQGYLQGRVRKLKRPGGFKRMDSTARKIQARQARREAVEAAKQAQPTKEAQEAIQATAEDIQLEIQQVKLETLENGGSIWADTGTDAKQ